VAFAFIFGGNGRVKSHRFSYVGSSYRQLAQLIFFGKDGWVESLNRTTWLGEEIERHFIRAHADLADGCIRGSEP
jgi:hypothetical protein